jgi:biofilm PGA synthesis N-glycosyltransferase PgaC
VTLVLFWLSLGLLFYVYAGYPLIAWLRGHLRPRRCARAPIEPPVTAIVVAHNESSRICRRIENLLGSDYTGSLQILVGSDGSTDDTAQRARLYGRLGVKVFEFAERRGKAAVLNELVPAASGDIVVLADARQRFEHGAIRALVENFADPAVGAVSGELILAKRRKEQSSGDGQGFYWKYEKFIRANESGSGSTVGATGAIYAIRRELFDPIPEDYILDDVVIPVRIARRGYRVLFEAAARAYDWVPPAARAEFSRKARTIAGTFQLLVRETWLLDPRRSPVWFEALSHKALRLTIPLLHALLFAANVHLVSLRVGREYELIMAGQLAFYAAALTGHALATAGRRRPMLLSVPYTICLMLWATIVGFARFITRRQRVTWERVVVQGDGRV